VIIGKTVRIRYPEEVSIGDNCIIDDFTYISTSLVLKANIHISPNCSIIGGKNSSVSFDEYSTTSPGVVLVAGSDDYVGGIANPMAHMKVRGNHEIGHIRLGRHCIVGSNSVVLPNVVFGEGAAVGALSLVRRDLEPWTLSAGIPAKKIKNRNKEQILSFEKTLKNKIE